MTGSRIFIDYPDEKSEKFVIIVFENIEDEKSFFSRKIGTTPIKLVRSDVVNDKVFMNYIKIGY